MLLAGDLGVYDVFRERVPVNGALKSLGSNRDDKLRLSGRIRFGGSLPFTCIPGGGSSSGEMALAPRSFNCDL